MLPFSLALTSESYYAKMFYYLSIGSNINPEHHIGRCFEILLQRFESLASYPFCFTQPEEIDSKKKFVNSICILKYDTHPVALKSWLSDLEIFLGRDRSNPLRGSTDRTCDLDILGFSKKFEEKLFHDRKEGYIKTVLSYRERKAKHIPTPSIYAFGSKLPNRPSTIHLKRSPGHEIIILDGHQHFKNGFKSRFSL